MDVSDNLAKSIIRILSPNGDVAGAGFLISDRQALTCAHVVAQSLNIFEGEKDKPSGQVYLDFPGILPGRRFRSRILFWLPVQSSPSDSINGEEDIAVLELEDDIPESCCSLPFAQPQNVWGHNFRAFGFPTGSDRGVWASGVLRAAQAGGWVQIDDDRPTGYFVAPGFSGTPVWDEQVGGVVGMVVAADNRASIRAAFMIPTLLLVAALSSLELNLTILGKEAQNTVDQWEVETLTPIFDGPPAQHTAFSLQTRTCNEWALDLMTVWGLNRNPFIGILASLPGRSVFEGLLATERLLAQASNRGANQVSLPSRRWIRLQPNQASLNSVGQQTRSWQQTPEMIGILIEIGIEYQRDDLANSVRAGCDTLLSRYSVPISIIIHIMNTPLDRAIANVKSIYSNLDNGWARLPIGCMRLGFRHPSLKQYTCGLDKIDCLFKNDYQNVLGAQFCCWVEEVIRTVKELDGGLYPEGYVSTRKLAQYDAVIDRYRALRRDDASCDHLSSKRAIDDLDAIAAAEVARTTSEDVGRLDRQFLELVHEYLPSRIHEIVCAFASSDRIRARLEALSFAVFYDKQAHSEGLVEAWVSGSDFGDLQYPLNIMTNNPSTSEIKDYLAMALLRLRDRGPHNELIERAINTQNLEGDAKLVRDFYFGKLPQDDFLNEATTRVFLLAKRANIKIMPSARTIKRFSIEDHEFWWLLLSQAPSDYLVRQFLELDARRRAVLGLCSPEEWQVIKSDETVVLEIQQCRRDRLVG